MPEGLVFKLFFKNQIYYTFSFVDLFFFFKSSLCALGVCQSKAGLLLLSSIPQRHISYLSTTCKLSPKSFSFFWPSLPCDSYSASQLLTGSSCPVPTWVHSSPHLCSPSLRQCCLMLGGFVSLKAKQGSECTKTVNTIRNWEDWLQAFPYILQTLVKWTLQRLQVIFCTSYKDLSKGSHRLWWTLKSSSSLLVLLQLEAKVPKYIRFCCSCAFSLWRHWVAWSHKRYIVEFSDLWGFYHLDKHQTYLKWTETPCGLRRTL